MGPEAAVNAVYYNKIQELPEDRARRVRRRAPCRVSRGRRPVAARLRAGGRRRGPAGRPARRAGRAAGRRRPQGAALLGPASRRPPGMTDPAEGGDHPDPPPGPSPSPSTSPPRGGALADRVHPDHRDGRALPRLPPVAGCRSLVVALGVLIGDGVPRTQPVRDAAPSRAGRREILIEGEGLV